MIDSSEINLLNRDEAGIALSQTSSSISSQSSPISNSSSSESASAAVIKPLIDDENDDEETANRASSRMNADQQAIINKLLLPNTTTTTTTSKIITPRSALFAKSPSIADDYTSVRVAIRIRPQSTREKIEMCKVCTNVTPNEPQVTLGCKDDKSFTYDFVYDIQSRQDHIFNTSVKTLIDGCFEGYNATVLAYGQTGSGKTYTMGTSFDPTILPDEDGIIPRAIAYLFQKIEFTKNELIKNGVETCLLPKFTISAQFLELYNEEIIDLFENVQSTSSKFSSNLLATTNGATVSGIESVQVTPRVLSGRSRIEIHEDHFGGINVQGCSTREVRSINETLEMLKNGARIRTTGATNMNLQSSRSHAIFTLHLKQIRVNNDVLIKEINQFNDSMEKTTDPNDYEFETLSAKFHFVDLAGSERLKRTGATGHRAKEGICINRGLLALGNVISALGDKDKRGSHVPYRDSKLTRLLQDSLGGNSRTLMIACVSPSDRDFMETLNTLRYANRARNIKNRISVNQDTTSQQISLLKAEIERLNYELMQYKAKTCGSNKSQFVSSETSNSISSSRTTSTATIAANSGYNGQDHQSSNNDFFILFNDVKQENDLLLRENQNLRIRIKAMHETVDAVKTRNCELELLSVKNLATEAEENILASYIKQNENLRCKLAETESLCKQLQNHQQYSQLIPSTSGSFVKTSISKEDSFNNDITSNSIDIAKNQKLIEKAKHELESDLNNLKHLQSKRLSFSSINLDNTKQHIHNHFNSVKNLNDSVYIKGDSGDNDVTGSFSEQQFELEKNLNDLSLEIDIKKKLISELETNSKNFEQMRLHYEEKMTILHDRIKQIEDERDKIISNMTKINEDNKFDDQIRKIKLEYEFKLKNLQSELIKYQQIKSKNSQMIKSALETDKQLQQLHKELLEMKRLKVKLMNQLRDETLKNKQDEQKRVKEIALLKRDHLKKDNQIKSLEAEKRCRDIVLKRKQEQIQALRKYSSRMSEKASGRAVRDENIEINTTVLNKSTTTNSAKPKTSSLYANTKISKFTLAMQKKWEKIDQSVHAIIIKKQTIGLIEREMERFLEQREKISRKLNRLEKRLAKAVSLENSKDSNSLTSSNLTNTISNSTSSDMADSIYAKSPSSLKIDELKEQVDIMKSNIDYLQDQIGECQSNIIQLEEAKDGSDYGVEKLINTINTFEEAKFILKKFFMLALNKGIIAAQKEYLNNELEYELEQFERDYNIQQQLLQNMINSSPDNTKGLISTNNQQHITTQISINNNRDFCNDNYEIDEIILAPRMEDSSSESEDDDEVITRLVNNETLLLDEQDRESYENVCINLINSANKSMGMSESITNSNSGSSNSSSNNNNNKARQLTTTGPQDFLFVSTNTNDNSHNYSPNNQINETNLLQSSRICSKSYTKIPDVIKDSCMATNKITEKKINTDDHASNSYLNNISMSKSVIVTASDKATFNRMTRSTMSRNTSRDSVMSTSPESPTSRRNGSIILKNDNVFNRLTSETKQSPMPEQGHIKNYSGNTNRFRASPITLTHVAEGHSKAILSVDSFDYKLFTGSKDRTAKVWDLITGQELASLTGHINNVIKIKYCENTRTCFTLSAFYVKVWDLRESNTKSIKTLSSSGISCDGDITAGLTRTNTRVLQNEIPFGEKIINDFAIDKSEQNFFTASGSSVKIWDLRKFMPIGQLTGGHNSSIMTMLVDGNLIITGSKDHYIKVFEIFPNYSNMTLNSSVISNDLTTDVTVALKHTFNPPHYDGVQSLLKTENSLFSGSRDMCIKKWNMNDYHCKQSINNAHKDWICSLDHMKNYNNNDLLLSGCRGGYLKFWNINTFEKIADFRAHLCPINSIKVNKNFVFTASDDATVRIWKRDK